MHLGRVVVWVAAGCGSVSGSEKRDAAIDSASIDAPSVDAPGKPCNLDAPFQTPVPVPGLDADTNSIWVSADELTGITVAPVTGTGMDLFTTTRTQRDAAFGPRTRIPASTSASDYGGSLSPDGLTLIFNPDSPEDIFVSTRATTTAMFTSATSLAAVSTSAAEGDARLSATGIYFERFFNGAYRLMYAQRNATGFDVPVEVAGIASASATGQDAMTPQPSMDELTIYFLSTRTGGTGGRDIWVAKRTSKNAAFATPTPVTELNTANSEIPSGISGDGCRLYYASGSSILVASKPKM